MFTMPRPQAWAPEDPQPKRIKLFCEDPNPHNTPIKGVDSAVYQSLWMGLGDYDRARKRVIFHPVPITPTKISEEKVIREKL